MHQLAKVNPDLPKQFWKNAAFHLEAEVTRLEKHITELNLIKKYQLTPSEIKTLKFIACGLTREQIAKRLCISSRTVNTYQEAIYSKINVNSQLEASLWVLRAGLLTIDEAWTVVAEEQSLT